MESQVLSEESRRRFSGHIPDIACVEKMREIRAGVRALALLIETKCPPGRDRAEALTQLEYVMMSANGSIVRSYPIDPKEM